MRRRLPAPWREEDWNRLEGETLRRARARRSEHGAWEEIRRHSRRVLSSFSSSFFIVTRFLPPGKRAQVEVTYAAVRYPDEIVDTFPLTTAERLGRLRRWEDQYESALTAGSIQSALAAGAPSVLAAWASVVQRSGIPPRHYRAFLAAMRHDASPDPFTTLDHLIDGYIHGSAIVVGYFLAYIYGPARGRDMAEALAAARDLGIALQLTNFLRDVREDAYRGRVYLPQEWLRGEGIASFDVHDPEQHAAIARVLGRLAGHADRLYDNAQSGLDAFAEDSRVAIQACIDVYRQLNARIGRRPHGFLHREQVPLLDKYRVLPASKYWRLPLAYLAG